MGVRPNLDFIRANLAEYCQANGTVLPEPSRGEGAKPPRRSHVKLGPEFEPGRDIPPTFAHLLGGMAIYEQGYVASFDGVWIGSIEWLKLSGVYLGDERLTTILDIFGCQAENVHHGYSSFAEPVDTYPFAEDFSITLRQENNAEEPFEGPGEPQHTLVGLNLPPQAEPKPFQQSLL